LTKTPKPEIAIIINTCTYKISKQSACREQTDIPYFGIKHIILFAALPVLGTEYRIAITRVSDPVSTYKQEKEATMNLMK